MSEETIFKVVRVRTSPEIKAKMVTLQAELKKLGKGHNSFESIYQDLADRWLSILISEAVAEVAKQSRLAQKPEEA